MKTNSMYAVLIALLLSLSNIAIGSTTLPIDNPSGLTMFAYANEIIPDHFDGIGTGQLYLVDTNSVRYKFFPRPHINGEEKSNQKVQVLSKEEEQKLLHRFHLLEAARKNYAAKGLGGYKSLMMDDSTVVKVVELPEGDENPSEVAIFFSDGEVEYENFCDDGKRLSAASRPDPQEFWMSQVQEALTAGQTIWFGSGYFIHGKTTTEERQNFRDALKTLRAGENLSAEQQRSAAGHQGVKYDALR